MTATHSTGTLQAEQRLDLPWMQAYEHDVIDEDAKHEADDDLDLSERPGRWKTEAHQGTASSATDVSLAVLVYARTLRASPFRKRVCRKPLI